MLQDTEVILWDVVAETGIARFSGHKGIVTSVLFINGKNCIVSSSKDTFVKFWDIETKHCFKTLGGHQMEVGGRIFIFPFLIKTDCQHLSRSLNNENSIFLLLAFNLFILKRNLELR